MAITRAQQYRQMLENGGRGISLQEAKDMAPKGEFLAYINKKEAKMLKDAGGSGIMTNAGIPSFIEYGSDDPDTFSQAASTGSVQGDVDRGGGDENNQREQRKREREREKIRKQIAKGPTLARRITRNPLFQTASFFSNPLGFIGRKIMDERRAKRVNELFGVDDDLGYTGADMGFVVSQPPKPEATPDRGDDGPEQMIAETPYQEDLIEDEVLSPIQQAILERDRLGGPRAFAKEGGIMDLETGRQMYFLGKLVKKATRAVKKIAKSPIGKAALLYAGGTYLGGLSGVAGTTKSMGFLESLRTPSNLGNLFNFGKSYIGEMNNKDLAKLGIGGALTLAPLLFQDDDSDEEYQKFASQSGPGLPATIPDIRKNYKDYMARAFVADGGIMRLGFDEGGKDLSTDANYKGWKKLYEKNPDAAAINENHQQYLNFYERNKTKQAEGSKEPVAKKTMPLLDMDGKEMDLRAEGGFVPIGRMEKADDVPARLSKNEFVFTADAVRNAGDGDVDKGAEVMYNMMKNLESGGDVSEESQGLEGARRMFQTSQRLEEVL
jgi:hypothetical protein